MVGNSLPPPAVGPELGPPLQVSAPENHALQPLAFTAGSGSPGVLRPASPLTTGPQSLPCGLGSTSWAGTDRGSRVVGAEHTQVNMGGYAGLCSGLGPGPEAARCPGVAGPACGHLEEPASVMSAQPDAGTLVAAAADLEVLLEGPALQPVLAAQQGGWGASQDAEGRPGALVMATATAGLGDQQPGSIAM